MESDIWLEDARTAQPQREGAGPSPNGSARRRPQSEEQAASPLPPSGPEDLGVSQTFLEELILKTLYHRGAITGDLLASAIRLPFWALDDALLAYQRQKLVQVPRSDGMGRRGYTFELTGEGRRRAREMLDSSPYVGPAPVNIERYQYWIERQSVRRVQVGPEQVREGLKHLVLEEKTMEVIGPAINAARSVFIYGEPGNGKTTVSEAVVDIFGDHIYVPWAVYADGEVIQLYDPVIHQALEEDDPGDGEAIMYPPPAYDRRFVKVKRPMVMVGGELTLEQLELRYDARTGSYQAPPQMKANGGVFVIDDFGRQHVPPRDLLNRWMIPLDRGIDYLIFPSGRRVAIPFACVVIFATNLNPGELVEEAFLRRIRYKIRVGTPDRVTYTEIFRRVCKAKGIAFDEKAVDWLFREYYDGQGIAPRACHPGDLISDIFDLSDYLGITPSLRPELLVKACHSYFMDLPTFVERRKSPDRRKVAATEGDLS